MFTIKHWYHKSIFYTQTMIAPPTTWGQKGQISFNTLPASKPAKCPIRTHEHLYKNIGILSEHRQLMQQSNNQYNQVQLQ